MGVCGHEAQALNGLGVDGNVTTPTITLGCVLKNKGLGCGTEGRRIHRAGVCSIPTSKTFGSHHAPIGDSYSVDGLIEDTFSRNAQREGGGEGVVESQGSLPNLRHLELRIHGVNSGRNGTILGLNRRRITHALKFVQEGGDVSLSVLGHQTTRKLAHIDISVTLIIGNIRTGVVLKAFNRTLGGIVNLGFGI